MLKLTINGKSKTVDVMVMNVSNDDILNGSISLNNLLQTLAYEVDNGSLGNDDKITYNIPPTCNDSFIKAINSKITQIEKGIMIYGKDDMINLLNQCKELHEYYVATEIAK